jgi:hypothetical protein
MIPGHDPLFHKEFLSERLAAYELSSVVNISGIRQTLKKLNEALESGKLDHMKEEAIKSQFLTQFFGDILGFNYKNSDNWLFQEEVKTDADATKPDGALGLFYITESGIRKDVRVVIEAKSAGTDLDAIQKDRVVKISPVDQAMLYASKMGTNCRWVVVTNIRELRFYQANDQTRYQKFLLADLQEEEHLRELLLLFLREHFYTGQESSTDGLLRLVRKAKYERPVAAHIVDQLYNSLKKFEQLPFVDPRLIANMKPFNILDVHVWHYEDGHLLSLNPEIYGLLKGISIENGQVLITQEYEATLKEADILEYMPKIDYILGKLYHSHIFKISALADLEKEKAKNKGTLGYSYLHMMHLTAANSVTLKLKLPVNEDCDCMSCTYQSLNFGKLIRKVEQLEENGEGNTLEAAYGHYLLCTDNFKRSYRIYKHIEREAKGDDKRVLEYFCVKYNIKHLHNLFFSDAEYSTMRKDARSIDLDRVIGNELDLFADKDMRKAMLYIKEDKLFEHAVKRSDELLKELKNVRTFMSRGGNYTALPNYINQFYRQFTEVFGHVQKNFLVYDKFTDYRKFTATIFCGMVISYRTRKYHISDFSAFILTEAILHIKPKDLKEILEPVKKLKVKDKEKAELLTRATSYFRSYASKGLFGDPYANILIEKQLTNSHFKDQYTDVFSNLCTVLSYIDWTADVFADTAAAVINFVKVDQALVWWEVEQLGKLIERKASLFTAARLDDLLSFALDHHRLNKTNKYERLIGSICKGLRNFYPDYRFNHTHTAKRAILNCQSENGHCDFRPLSGLWHISTDAVKTVLTHAFEEQLDERFDDDLYEHLLKAKVMAYDRKDYLDKLAETVDRQKGAGFTGFEDGLPKHDDFACYNFLLIPYILELDFELPAFKRLTNLSAFESWLADPFHFDYTSFDARWLIVTDNHYILKRLAGYPPVKEKLSKFLKENYDKALAKTFFKYFS